MKVKAGLLYKQLKHFLTLRILTADFQLNQLHKMNETERKSIIINRNIWTNKSNEEKGGYDAQGKFVNVE
jgi:hypothetical protein